MEETVKKQSNNTTIYLFIIFLFVMLLAFTGEQRIKDVQSQMRSVQQEEEEKAQIKEARRLAGLANHALKKVPNYYQWDIRWKNQPYGYGNMGTSGCGATCMSMVYVYFTGDEEKNPGWIGNFSRKNGYCAYGGTSWSFMDTGAKKLGLKVQQIPVNEKKMKKQLDKERVMICSMRPGDFTKSGHFIVLTGYNDKGFTVNDPNSRENSKKSWSFDRIKGQIKNTWSYWQ